ncbi:FHA domain-containing protein [Azospira restricta]|uniref:FHA domain-containing protein n=1 Tax=Azospira restricta TaxID=404405 RepID=A0A974SPC9_9RHOO|nr:FHA domain-containing protein [Azospira restricta]QRJ63944.1 FHA domain-containing protein [Azospira restricta]
MNEGNLSILCADLSGAERLDERLAASEVAHALGRCEKRIAQAVEGFRGRLQRLSATRIVAYFGDAEDALQSAVEMQRRVVALPPLSGVSLALGVGVCVGHAADEIRYFEGDDNVACRLADLAEAGRVLVSVPRRAQGFAWNARSALARDELSLSCGKRRLGVFEIDWRHFVPPRGKLPAAGAAGPGQLFVHAGGTTIELNAARPLLTIGRLASCGLRLTSERCSRVHARIELRGGSFVLVDQSTNGSFVQPEGGGEHAVHRRELALHGCGRIGFGSPLAAAGTESIEFRTGGAP